MVAASLWQWWLEDVSLLTQGGKEAAIGPALCSPPFLPQDVGLLEYQHHPRDYASHLSPSSIIQPQRRRPSLLSEFQPGSER